MYAIKYLERRFKITVNPGRKINEAIDTSKHVVMDSRAERFDNFDIYVYIFFIFYVLTLLEYLKIERDSI